jgi:MAPEG family
LSKFYLASQKKEEFAKAKKDGTPLPHRQKNFFVKLKYYNSDDWLALMGDRAVGNTLEQGLIFVPLLWMHAVFVDPTQSWTIALIYSISRGIYPIMFTLAFGYGMLPAIGVSTAPGYLTCIYLMYQLAVKFVLA